jgi:hypothetical protein
MEDNVQTLESTITDKVAVDSYFNDREKVVSSGTKEEVTAVPIPFTAKEIKTGEFTNNVTHKTKTTCKIVGINNANKKVSVSLDPDCTKEDILSIPVGSSQRYTVEPAMPGAKRNWRCLVL